MESRIFDFHYHLLFKHQISDEKNIDTTVETKGLAGTFNDLMGGAFDSQSSPQQLAKSQLHLGVIAMLSVEHAFANRIFHLLGINLSAVVFKILDKPLFDRTRLGKTTYFKEFSEQVDFYLTHRQHLENKYKVKYLFRTDFQKVNFPSAAEVKTFLDADKSFRYMSFSIEGGHNLSNMPIRQLAQSFNPEIQLKAIQDENKLDFISINLCHLSEIPEQSLGGFAQGVNGLSQIAFHSKDFLPKTALGVSERGKKVIEQALTHTDRPILIDVKHMSLYTRLHYYKIKQKLAVEKPDTARLPIISSHTGFTFTTTTDYLDNKRFKSETYTSKTGDEMCEVRSENRRIGRTNDAVNKKIWCNPWTINLFDDEIVTIMESKGMIGISLDQRVIGATNIAVDSLRIQKYFEKEFVPKDEWKKLFKDGIRPEAEGLSDLLDASSREERHIMLFCFHIIHAVRVGLVNLPWVSGTSPWDHLCIGSDYDGLINPLNGFNDVTRLDSLSSQLEQYLPVADKYLVSNSQVKALPYNADGTIDSGKLKGLVEKFMYLNGQHFIIRFLSNWQF